MHTISFLEGQIINNELFGTTTVNVETVGRFLCGVNWELAKKPFSKEFLENVAYNSTESMYAILWLQLTQTN
jgi:hypothetical protein